MKIAPQEEHWNSCHSSCSHASDEFGICNVIEMWFPTCSNTLSAVLLYIIFVMSTTSPFLSSHFDSLRKLILGSRVVGMAQWSEWSESSPPLSEAMVWFLPGAICGLRLLVLALLWRFFSGFSSFPPSTKTNTQNSNSRRMEDVASSLNILIHLL